MCTLFPQSVGNVLNQIKSLQLVVNSKVKALITNEVIQIWCVSLNCVCVSNQILFA